MEEINFAQDIKEKFNLARQAGIDNINMDMICGLPEEGMEELSYTLDEIKKLDPESLTVHALAVKRFIEIESNERYISLWSE